MKSIISILLLFSSLFSFAQSSLNWVNTAVSGATSVDVIEDVAVDVSGNTYSCGYFSGSIDFGDGVHVAGIDTQAFVVKYNSVGTVQWSITSSGDNKAFANTIYVDDDGFVYIGGYHTSSSTNFGTLSLPTVQNEELFLLKLSPAGNPLHFIGPGNTTNGKNRITAITGNNTELYITGYFFQNPLILGGNTTIAPTQEDVFIARMDTALAATTWLVAHGGASSKNDISTSIAIEGATLIITGTYGNNSTCTFFTTGADYVLPNNGRRSIWLARCNINTGEIEWANSASAPNGRNNRSDGVALQGGQIYIAGSFNEWCAFNANPSNSASFFYIDTVFSNGGRDILMARYDYAGNYVNSWSEGGAGDDEAHSVTLDLSCFKVDICGQFENSVNFGGTELLTANGIDMFVASYDNTGVFNWAFKESSPGDIIANAIASNGGDIAVGGIYSDSLTFSTTPGTMVTNAGLDDHYVFNFNCAPAPLCTISIVCPPNDTVVANTSCQSTLLNYTGMATTTTSCGFGSISQTPLPGTIINSGVNEITLILTDLNGNVDSCKMDVIIESNVNPTIVSCGTSLIGETTFGSNDTENNFGCVGFSTPGEDVYYQFTVPAGNYWMQISIDNATDVNDLGIETFWTGGVCPVGGGCIDADYFDIGTQEFSGGGNTLQYLAVGPATYYFVVDAKIDGIDSYDISFNCLNGGVQFDESVSCGDSNNDGLIPYLNGATSLNTETCEADTICHDMFTANINGFEWIDSVYMNLGSCYTNVIPTNVAGFYQPGNWIGTYLPTSNGISWQFNHTTTPAFGDGSDGNYSCDLAKTRITTLCFTADISATCAVDSNLNVAIFISDDGVGSSGNTAASFDRIISDDFTISNPAPTITCSGNKTINSPLNSCDTIVNLIAPVVFNDNCPLPFVSYVLTGATSGSGLNDASGTLFNPGITTVKYIVSDSLGRKDSCSFTITVIDPESPTITCPTNLNVNNDIGVCTAVVNSIAPTSFNDNCTIDSVSYTLTGATLGSGLNDASGTIFNPGITTVTYTITDASGNSTSCSFTVTIIDNQAPSITCPTNINANNDIGACTAVINSIAPTSFNDNCMVDSVSYILTGATLGSGLNDASGTAFNSGTTTITYTVTDTSGNSTSCNFTIIVTDNIAPSITCPANVNTPNDVGVCTAVVNSIAPTSFNDNCMVDSINYILTGATTGSGLNDASGTAFNPGTTTVTYTITDASGNTDNCSFTVTVTDNIAPTITCPTNLNVNNDIGVCTAVVNSIAPTSFNDNCMVDSVNYTLTGATLGSGLNDASGTVFNPGITNVTYTITDASGNTDNCSFTVTIIDNQAPSINCPTNINANNDIGFCTAVINSIAPTSFNDNCMVDSVSYILTGATTGSGLNDASGTVFNPGTTTVIYTVTDTSGNTANCSFTVTVIDNIAPTITCPVNVNTPNDVGVCTAVVNSIAPTSFNDNCMVDSVNYILTGATIGSGLNDASGTVFNSGTTTVIYTVTDTSGNTTNCNFTVTVTDNIAPTITCPVNVNTPNDVGVCTAVVNSIGPASFNDNCMVDSVSYILTGATLGSGLNDASGTVFNPGTTTVIYTVTDTSGNSTNCNFTVTVTDNIAPSITCPTNVNVNNDIGFCTAIVNSIAPVSFNDNCTVDSVSYTLSGATIGSGLNDANGTSFNLGTTIVTYTVTDNSGNTADCNFTVTVIDNEAPTITCPANVNTPNDIGVCNAVVNGIAPVSFNDNCMVDSINYILTGATIGSGLDDASGTTFNLGTTTVRYSITDIPGNTTVCSFTVTVIDNEAPTITCPTNINVNNDIGVCTAAVNSIAPTSFNDNCMVDSVNYILTGATTGSGLNDASGIVFNPGTTTVTYMVTDTSGNTANCNFTVTVIDSIAPSIACPTNVNTNNDIGFCTAVVNSIGPSSFSDNCMIDSVSYTLSGATIGSGLNDASGTSFNLGTTTVTYTVIDTSNNATDCNFTVTVIDNEAPTITCPTDINLNNDTGFCFAIANNIAPISSSDNCLVDSVNYTLSGATIGSGLNDASGTSFNIGITDVNYIVYDFAGNSDSCSFKVTVIDNENPSIICPSNIVICDTNILVPLLIADDNCMIESVTNDYNFSNNASGIYPYGITTVNWLVTDTSGNTNSCIMTIESKQDLVSEAGPDQFLVDIDSTSFDANSFSGTVGNWSIISGYGIITDVANPNSTVSELEEGENIFEWTISNDTCADAIDQVVITMVPLVVPNGFSPNNDGDNDMFVIVGLNLFENEVTIFNRWGLELFNTKNYQNDWDGRSSSGENLPEDTYFYTIQIPELNKDLSGFIVLKR